MKYSLFKITMVLVLGTSLVSCKKYLDINANPNNAVEVDPKLLFSFAATTLVNNRAGGDLFIPMALAGQSMASGGSSSDGASWGSGAEDQYVISPLSSANIWGQFYTSVAINLKKAISLSESATPVNNNAAAQCKVVLAETFYELTTIFGDIPFTEALDDQNLAPHFDPQETVLNGCLTMLDDAIKQFEPDNSDYLIGGSYDLFYGGDIEKWTRAARSLKLRILMTMVDKDDSKKTQIAALISEDDMIQSAGDNMFIAFQDIAGKRNPKYQIDRDYLAGVDFFYPSPYVLIPMELTNDPRIPIFFQTAAEWRPKLKLKGGATTYVAVTPGANADDFNASKISTTLHSATEPEVLFSYQEQLFYEAEIYARGLGVAQDLAMANTKFKAAVTASAIYYGVAAGDAQAFAAQLPTLNSSNAMPLISLQHWIDKMDRGIDAFTQFRRSGPQGSEVPNLQLPVNAPAGGLFRRFEYPESAELSSNANAPKLVDFTEKVWFDL